MESSFPLLESDTISQLRLSRVWQLFHFALYLLGGSLFILGTACLYAVPEGGLLTHLSYIVGSLAFLLVDSLELAAFFTDASLRANISVSATGSSLYVLGSIGYIDAVARVAPSLGPLGFLLGSLCIAVSQAWKLRRVACQPETLPASEWLFAGCSLDKSTQLCVEFCALLGCLGFGTGTLAGISPALVAEELSLWLAGSVFFTLASLFVLLRMLVL